MQRMQVLPGVRSEPCQHTRHPKALLGRDRRTECLAVVRTGRIGRLPLVTPYPGIDRHRRRHYVADLVGHHHQDPRPAVHPVAARTEYYALATCHGLLEDTTDPLERVVLG